MLGKQLLLSIEWRRSKVPSVDFVTMIIKILCAMMFTWPMGLACDFQTTGFSFSTCNCAFPLVHVFFPTIPLLRLAAVDCWHDCLSGPCLQQEPGFKPLVSYYIHSIDRYMYAINMNMYVEMSPLPL